jgi:cytochrome c biogenesis protein CcdA
MLLFIFALGLGIPLMFVSTFLGRTSRKSFIWRIMRGKGWFINVPSILVTAVWALAIWGILVAVTKYSFVTFDSFAGQTYATTHTIGLLIVSLLGALLWASTSPGGLQQKRELHLHTTQLVSGVLFLILGVLMLNGRMSEITGRFANGESLFYGVEERIYEWIQ